MNSREHGSKSFWMEIPAVSAPILKGEVRTDVAIAGAGIAGLSVAYHLSEKSSLSIAVLDRGALSGGMTSRTTAHLTYSHDDLYDEVISRHGEEIARKCFQSQKAAIDMLEQIQKSEGIACDFERLPGYLIARREDDVKVLEDEKEACSKLGFEGVEWARGVDVQGPYTRALLFPDQAKFHPTKFTAGLIKVLKQRGVKFFANSPVQEFEERGGLVNLDTPGGRVVAKNAVLATNSPIANRVVVHDKQAPYRTYAFAARMKKGALENALYWDTDEPYHYVRLHPATKEYDYLIVGGEDHRTGEADDAENRFSKLEKFAREYFPKMGKIDYRWSGQVLTPVDFLPFIGKNPGNERIYLATGDSGQGFTNGSLAGLILSDLILGRANVWAEMHDPSRKNVKSAIDFVSENISTARNFAQYLSPSEVASEKAIKRRSGALIRDGAAKLAVYRDSKGALHKRSAACTHSGCLVHWNSFEECWDCTCHGSHFGPLGEVTNAPAMGNLKVIQDQAVPRRKPAAARKVAAKATAVHRRKSGIATKKNAATRRKTAVKSRRGR